MRLLVRIWIRILIGLIAVFIRVGQSWMDYCSGCQVALLDVIQPDCDTTLVF